MSVTERDRERPAAPVRSVGLIAKRTHERLAPTVEIVERVLTKHGVKVLFDKECGKHLGRPGDGVARRTLNGKVDLGICIGGDGTFLSVARKFAPFEVAILSRVSPGTSG